VRRALETPHGALPLPAFLPDATRGTVRATDAESVASVGIRALMTNAFHLMIRPGADRIRRLGGLHRFMGWNGPIVCDSGGFQAMSMLRENPRHGSVTQSGLVYRVPGSDRKLKLTPEKCVQTQLALGADVLVALDDCPQPNEPYAAQREAVERTLLWAEQCRDALARHAEQRRLAAPPTLVGVVHGGSHDALRIECAQALIDMGFSAFGYGGWPIDADGALLLGSFAATSGALPADAPRFALGVGKPEHVVAVARLGGRWIFDCTIPTRDARHHRLYTFATDPTSERLPSDRSFYRCVYILDESHAGSREPLEPGCDCPCCRRHDRAYLHHLFKIEDPQALRLATLHNLRFYARLVDALAAEASRDDASHASDPAREDTRARGHASASP
jgi:queuine tRNA-ribosyltransferase